MKTIVAAMLCSSLAFADPPVDAPMADELGVSVLIKHGDPAPFDGRLLSMDENIARAKRAVECKATLAAAEENALLPKPVVALLISAAAAAVITSIGLGIALAVKK